MYNWLWLAAFIIAVVALMGGRSSTFVILVLILAAVASTGPVENDLGIA